MFTPYKPWKVALTCLACLLWIHPLTSTAQIPSPKPGTHINDLAGILDKDNTHDLDDAIQDLEKKYSVQLAVVLVNKLPDGISIEDYARNIGQKWHVGIHDSGLVYVASISERKQRLEVSNALNQVISDKDAHDITNNIKTFFRNKDYQGGLVGLISDIDDHFQAAVEGSAAAQTQPDQTPSANTTPVQLTILDQSPGWNWSYLFIFGVIGAVILFVISVAFRGVRRTRPSRDTNLIHNSIHMSDPYHRSSSFGSTDMMTATGAAIIADQIIDNDPSPPSGSWGSSDTGSSDPGFSSSDSGFSGGGSTNDW